jgi:hypothetical protein
MLSGGQPHRHSAVRIHRHGTRQARSGPACAAPHRRSLERHFEEIRRASSAREFEVHNLLWRRPVCKLRIDERGQLDRNLSTCRDQSSPVCGHAHGAEEEAAVAILYAPAMATVVKAIDSPSVGTPNGHQGTVAGGVALHLEREPGNLPRLACIPGAGGEDADRGAKEACPHPRILRRVANDRNGWKADYQQMDR